MLLTNVYASSLPKSDVSELRLDNGLRIIVKPDNRAPLIVSMIWYNIGSVDEPAGILGITHALEHLMFKGTADVREGEFSKIISMMGGDDNAYTNYDHTVYYEKVANYQLPMIFKLEADRMQNLKITEQAFQKEMQVIEEERHLRIDNNPQGLLMERFLASAYINTPYRNPIIGWQHTLRQINLAEIYAWYHNFYQPNNATLVVVGAVTPEKVFDEAKKYFGAIKSKAKLPTMHYKEPEPLGPRLTKINIPANNKTLMLGFTVPSIINFDSKAAWEPYALELLAYALDGGESSRLTQNLIKTQRVANGVQVYYDTFLKQQSQFILIAVPANNIKLNHLKNALLQEIYKLQNQPISIKELEKIKYQIIANTILDQDSVYAEANHLGLLSSLNLPLNFDEKYITAIKKITPQQIQAVAKKYFLNNALTEARLLPTNNEKKES
jgi:zinc protease